MMVNVLSLEGKIKNTIELPSIFTGRVRQELIQRAVLAENSYKLQPQAHSTLAGMQTSARYYGRMRSYRTGRHMGIAIRPRQKLGGGIQGKVRRIPSAAKGRRAHPHQVQKMLIERINKKEYQRALASAISATASNSLRPSQLNVQLPIVIADDIESIKRAKDVINVFKNINLFDYINERREPHLRKGVRRSTRIRIYKKNVLLIVGKETSIMRAARNIPGVDVCDVSKITANLLAPGGVPGRLTIWSESAVNSINKAIEKIRV